MGEFAITFAIQGPWPDRQRKFLVFPCGNPNCNKAPDGKHETVVVEEGDDRKFCSKQCRVKWNNKRYSRKSRKVRC